MPRYVGPNQPRLLAVANSFAAAQGTLGQCRNAALGKLVSGRIRISAAETVIDDNSLRGALFSYEGKTWNPNERRYTRGNQPLSLLLEDDTYVLLVASGRISNMTSRIYPAWFKMVKSRPHAFVAPFGRTPRRDRTCSVCKGAKYLERKWSNKPDKMEACYNCSYSYDADGRFQRSEPKGSVSVGGVPSSLVPASWGLRISRDGQVQGSALIGPPVASSWAGGVTPETKFQKELEKGIADLLKLDDFLAGV